MSDHLQPLRGELLPASVTPQATLTLARSCFGDEIAIDFPSMGAVVDRLRDQLRLADESLASETAEVVLTDEQARGGAVVPLALQLRGLCADCGGRGESWSEPCAQCEGSGEHQQRHHFRLSLPPGVLDGTRFRFVVAPPEARATRVDVTISIA